MANFFINSQTLLQFTKSLVKWIENLLVEVDDVMSWFSEFSLQIGHSGFVYSQGLPYPRVT